MTCVLCEDAERQRGEITSFPSFDHRWGRDSQTVFSVWAPFMGQMECQSSVGTQMPSPQRGPRCFLVMQLCCSSPTLGALGIFCPFYPSTSPRSIFNPLTINDFFLLPKFASLGFPSFAQLFLHARFPIVSHATLLLLLSSFSPHVSRISPFWFFLPFPSIYKTAQKWLRLRGGSYIGSYIKYKKERHLPTLSAFPSGSPCDLEKKTYNTHPKIRHLRKT